MTTWPAALGSLAAALVDLALPETCVGCRAPGRVLCRSCAAALHVEPRRWPPDPVPPALPEAWAVTAYADAIRTALSAHKEDGRLALVRPLGDALGAGSHVKAESHTALNEQGVSARLCVRKEAGSVYQRCGD